MNDITPGPARLAREQRDAQIVAMRYATTPPTSYRDIAEKIGCSIGTVQKACTNAGNITPLAPAPPAKPVSPNVAAIRAVDDWTGYPNTGRALDVIEVRPAVVDGELVEPDFGEMDEHELVAKANEYYDNVQKAGESAVINAWLAGKALIAAKERVGHGGWGDWVTTNFHGTQRLAQYYMSLAEKTKRVSFLDPETSLRGVLKTIGPAKERSKSKFNKPRPKPSSNAFVNRFYRYLSRVQDNTLQLELMTKEKKFAENFDTVRLEHRDGLLWAHEVITRVLKQFGTDQDDLFTDNTAFADAKHE